MLILRVFLPFAVGYFLSFLLRVINAVIAPDLVAEMDLDASDLGLMTSTFFIAFAVTQLPLGVLLDRYGPRKVEGALLLVAAAGAGVFALADSFALLLLGRAMIGFGVSACMMAAFKAYASWVPGDRLPLINGCHLAAGGLGAIAGTAPVEFLSEAIGWRGVFVVVAIFTLLIAALIFFAIPRRGEVPPSEPLSHQIRQFGAVYRSALFWRIAPLTVVSQAAFFALQSLWAGPWLRDIGGLGREAAAGVLSSLAIAVFLGFLCGGGIADWVRRHRISPIAVGVLGMELFLVPQVLLLLGGAPFLIMTLTWGAFGLLGTMGYLIYAGLSQRFPTELAGRVNTGLNLLVFVAAFAAQWALGGIIELWPQSPSGGYAAEGYASGIVGLIALQVIAAGWYHLQPLLLRERELSKLS